SRGISEKSSDCSSSIVVYRRQLLKENRDKEAIKTMKTLKKTHRPGVRKKVEIEMQASELSADNNLGYSVWHKNTEGSTKIIESRKRVCHQGNGWGEFEIKARERDGMRAILESYDSELVASEYSPQLSLRVKEAEDMLQKVQAHNAEMEIQLSKAQEEAGTFKLQTQMVAAELEDLREQQKSNTETSTLATAEENATLRQKIEELEAERLRLEEQNNILEMRLERHNLQGDYDPVKTKVIHLQMNPTSIAKQQRAEEVEQLWAECQRLRGRLRKMEAGGAMPTDDTTLIIPPSQEILDLRKQLESAELKNQRLKEVFQKKIQEFRTACYVLTGYQIDITVENQYRLTSVYAEHMEDSLLFKSTGPVGSGSMQLLETDFSCTLTGLVDLHLFHQKSIPVFLSAVTIELFSRQTVS
ncbi:mitotic spindle assembly checkpoint protein MAD1, partial [Triplophysa rosa]